MNFVAIPEYANYNCSEEAAINYTTASALFSTDLSSDITLLNPQNAYDLYTNYYKIIPGANIDYIIERW